VPANVGFKEPGIFTPYSSVTPLIAEEPLWAPPLDRERIAAYAKYDEIYWNFEDAFKLVRRGDEDKPVYLPNPRVIVDTTAHFLLKGLNISSDDESLNLELQALLAREMFLSKFHTGKHSGCARGDFVMHITADPTKVEGTRISINSVDPAAYFPEHDEDNLDRVIAVDLVEQVLEEDPLDPNRVHIHRLRYEYRELNGQRLVWRFEGIYEPLDWWNKDKAVLIRNIREGFLPARIRTIPVYHFPNIQWQGDPFGASELRGFERVQSAVNQTISDEELALSLEGLGVYATDALPPLREDGSEGVWTIAPGKVIELPDNGKFARVQGVGSVRPFGDHMRMLIETMYEASATFRGGMIDAQVAESGIALALRFLPTEAKLEQRDLGGKEKLGQLTHDWLDWVFEYENKAFPESKIDVTLGAKLPQNRTQILNEFNNMLDRHVISKKKYRELVEQYLGYELPESDVAQILTELEQESEARAKGLLNAPSHQDGRDAPDSGNQSNNARRPNESSGSEAVDE
jgi:hypothetical protein